MSTAKDKGNNGADLERKEGGAEIPPPAELALPQPPPSPQHCPPKEHAAGSRSLDRRLNPNAPEFVPEFKAELLAAKLYEDMAPYTRWSTASSENISYGPRFDSIWREFSMEELRPTAPHFDGDSFEEMVDLELDEHQAMNIGAESYDPKLSRSATNPMAHSEVEVIEVVGDVQPQLQSPSQDQTLPKDRDVSVKDFRPRQPRPGRRCCILM